MGRIASSMSTSSVGMDGHGNSSEQHASQKSQQSAWFSGLALKPFIERGARQAEIEEANRRESLAAASHMCLGSCCAVFVSASCCLNRPWSGGPNGRTYTRPFAKVRAESALGSCYNGR